MSTSRGVFITGTDTDVGKTIFSAGLLLLLRQEGLDAGYLKPVATGAEDYQGQLASPDVIMIRKLVPDLDDPLEQMNPVCLRQPLCPLVAARLEGAHISVAKVRNQLRETLLRHPFTVVEGVGGVMVPLTSRLILLDLMVDLELPVLVVARPGLGTINHTLLTILAMRDRGLKVLGFVFSSPSPDQPPDPAIPHNPGLITDFSGVPFLGVLPWQEPDAQGLPDPQALVRDMRRHLDLDPVLSLAPWGSQP